MAPTEVQCRPYDPRFRRRCSRDSTPASVGPSECFLCGLVREVAIARESPGRRENAREGCLVEGGEVSCGHVSPSIGSSYLVEPRWGRKVYPRGAARRS